MSEESTVLCEVGDCSTSAKTGKNSEMLKFVVGREQNLGKIQGYDSSVL